jgi:hypothetical protein
MAMVFDDDGNLYVTQYTTQPYGCSIWRITPERAVSKFAGGIDTLRGIEWGGGTAFGNYLFGTLYDEIIRIGLDKTISTFADFSPPKHCPHSIRIDRTGRYGGYLYSGTGCIDHTYKVSPIGTVTLFSDFPGWTNGGGPYDIDFDLGTDYGGLMYMATGFGPDNPQVSGVFALEPDGKASRFAEGIVAAYFVAFDRIGYFNTEMFVVGTPSFSQPATLWRLHPDGTGVEFAQGTISTPLGLAFGPNGAMYIAEYSSQSETVTISVIIPEPATLMLFGCGLLCLLRRRRLGQSPYVRT